MDKIRCACDRCKLTMQWTMARSNLLINCNTCKRNQKSTYPPFLYMYVYLNKYTKHEINILFHMGTNIALAPQIMMRFHNISRFRRRWTNAPKHCHVPSDTITNEYQTREYIYWRHSISGKPHRLQTLSSDDSLSSPQYSHFITMLFAILATSTGLETFANLDCVKDILRLTGVSDGHEILSHNCLFRSRRNNFWAESNSGVGMGFTVIPRSAKWSIMDWSRANVFFMGVNTKTRRTLPKTSMVSRDETVYADDGGECM